MLYRTPPPDFKPKFDCAGVMIECLEDILLLHRVPEDEFGNLYCNPAGHSRPQEGLLACAIRETFEETGIDIKDNICRLKYASKFFVRYPEWDFNYELYRLNLDIRPDIVLNQQEHDSSIWIPPKKSLLLPMVPDLDEVIRIVYKL